ncbi:hypothetical protein [Massilia frigida]|uniref:hypothetical protein n=1 Tax=Massilia frigida TaxID=2609281 RepID=UPI00141ED03D|nr:hypothetical protein [Massilia frigida]
MATATVAAVIPLAAMKGVMTASILPFKSALQASSSAADAPGRCATHPSDVPAFDATSPPLPPPHPARTAMKAAPVTACVAPGRYDNNFMRLLLQFKVRRDYRNSNLLQILRPAHL